MVRFRTAPDGARISGRIALITPDTLRLESKSWRARSSFARNEVIHLERRIGGPGGTGRGMLIGLGVAGGLGYVWGTLVCESICESGDQGLPLAVGAALGAVGALAGGIVGTLASPSSWSFGVWPETAAVRIGFRIHLAERQ